MAHPKSLQQSENALPAPSYAAVAGLVAPTDTPLWLEKYFRNWGPSVMLHRGVFAVQPTKVTMKRKMVEVSEAAALLSKALTDTPTREFLEQAGDIRIENLGGLQFALEKIAERAESAAASPALTSKTGKTKSGQGKATPPNAIAPKTFCALVIAEAWKFVRGDYPAPRNREAAKAAEMFWLASGNTSAGWGADRMDAWRPHFMKARGFEGTATRAQCQRHLKLGKQFEEASAGII